MSKLKEMVNRGILNNNEEIYLIYEDHEFTGKIINNGENIYYKGINFTSLSSSAVYIIQSLPKNNWTSNHTNGWKRWRNWNGIFLSELRDKLND